MKLYQQWVRFAVVGAMGMVLAISVTSLGHELIGLSPNTSFALALSSLLAFHFVANAFFVFKIRASIQKFRRYGTSAVGFRLLEYFLFMAVHEVGGVYYALAGVLALSCSMVVKFAVYKYYVFA